jgi:hypothetical protein
MSPFCAHRPASLDERQLQRLLGALSSAELPVSAPPPRAAKPQSCLCTATAPFCAHRPSAFGDRLLQ